LWLGKNYIKLLDPNDLDFTAYLIPPFLTTLWLFERSSQASDSSPNKIFFVCSFCHPDMSYFVSVTLEIYLPDIIPAK
jgi:hypothetical protein